MDLPTEPLMISESRFKELQDGVQREMLKGREEFQKFVRGMREKGFSDDEIELMLD